MKSAYQNKKFANYWNKRAGESGEAYKQYVLDPLMLSFIDIQNKVILELGCGNGYLAKKLLEKNPKKVILMDISKYNIQFAKERICYDRVEFIITDATLSWPISDNSVDIIYSNMMLNEVSNINTPIKEAFRVLKKKGSFIFSVTHPSWDLFVFAQEKCGKESKKIKELGGYFRRGYAKYIMGSDSKTKPELSREFNQDFEVEHFQRPLSDYFTELIKNGFSVDKILEPELTKELLKYNPRFVEYKDHPIGLIFHAFK